MFFNNSFIIDLWFNQHVYIDKCYKGTLPSVLISGPTVTEATCNQAALRKVRNLETKKWS